MLIHFLQSAVSPPLLPILQVLLFPCSHPQELPPDWDGGPVPRNARRPQIPIESYQKTLYDTYFYCPKHLDLLCRYAKQNTMTVGELLLKFFYYYAFEFDYYHAVVSVRQRGFLDREEKSWRCLWKMQMQLCIEDPFEDDYDVAHVITPHTSQINAQTYCDCIKSIIDNGDEVLVLSMSGELSGTVNSARMAQREIGSDKVAVVDSKLVTFAYRALVMEAIRLIESGMSLNDIESNLNGIKEKVILLAVIDDLKYLRLGGRIGAAGKFFGDLLAIKPLLTIKNGALHAVGKAIGIKKGIQSICDLVNTYDVDMSRPRYIGHSNCVKRAEELKQKLTDNTQIGAEEIMITEIGATVGTHAGPGCTGVVFFVK